jgi:E3 ubiquitin-protein ligase BOI-like protein
VVVIVERAAAGHLRAAEAELVRARSRYAELEERLHQLAVEDQAWLGVARSHEAVVAGLRATLDQLLLQLVAVAATAVACAALAGPGCDDDGGGCAGAAEAGERVAHGGRRG